MNSEFENSKHAVSLLNAVLESTADGILIISNDGRVIKANRKFKELWKIPDAVLETYDDKKLLAYILDQLDQPELFLKKVKELYSRHEEESYDILRFKDKRIFERYSAPYQVESNVEGRVWSFRDVTKQKQIEESLFQDRILYRTIIDNLPDGIYAKDIECRKTLANPTDLRNMGCTMESEVLGKTDFDFFPKEDASAFYSDDQIVIKTGNAVINREESFIDKNGNKNWLLTTKVPIKDTDGEIIGIIGVGRDITLRKKSELIREALYEISESVLVTSDMETLYKKIHHAVSNLMPAKNFFIALYNDKKNILSFPYMVDEHEPPFASKPLGKGLIEYILRIGEPALIDAEKNLELRKTGEIELTGAPAAIWLGVPLKHENKVFGVIVVQDYENDKAYGNDEIQLLEFISEQIAQAITRRQNAEAIQNYTTELKELNQTKDKFFSIIAHDLRSPFQGLLGVANILVEDEEITDDERKIFIQKLYEGLKTQFNFIEDLLVWSRIQKGAIEFNPEPNNLSSLIEETISFLKNNIEKKNLNVHSEVPENLVLNYDRNMIATVMRNLLTNAIKFTNKNGLIAVGVCSNNGFIELQIKDSGVGMNQKTIDKLFRLDATQTTSGTDNETGTGLGLILCKEFVEKHGGKIWVESKEDEGSTFYFTLPNA